MQLYNIRPNTKVEVIMIDILKHLKNLHKLCKLIMSTRREKFQSVTSSNFENKINEYVNVFKYARADLFSKVAPSCNGLTDHEFWVIILNKIVQSRVYILENCKSIIHNERLLNPDIPTTSTFKCEQDLLTKFGIYPLRFIYKRSDFIIHSDWFIKNKNIRERFTIDLFNFVLDNKMFTALNYDDNKEPKNIDLYEKSDYLRTTEYDNSNIYLFQTVPEFVDAIFTVMNAEHSDKIGHLQLEKVHIIQYLNDQFTIIKKYEKAALIGNKKKPHEADVGSKKMFQAYVELRSFGIVFAEHIEKTYTSTNQYTASMNRSKLHFNRPTTINHEAMVNAIDELSDDTTDDTPV